MEQLRQLRRTRDLTFLDLAQLTGIPARAIAEAEYGLRRLSRHEAEAIALVLGLSPLTVRPSPPPPPVARSSAPALLAAGLATALALTPLVADLAPQAQRQLSALAIGQAAPWFEASMNASDLLPAPTVATVPLAAVAPAPLEPLTKALAPPVASAPLEPLTEALAPLVVPAPPRTPIPSVSPAFSFDEAGPRGCPVQPSVGQVVITQGYGVGTHAPAHLWGAIDLAVDSDGDGIAEPGPSWYTPVVATHEGQARVMLNSYPAGNHVWVLAPDGVWRTGYSHLAIVTVIDEQYVRAGETIGLMGSTGFASGPHLDYQVWRGEQNIDPTPLVGCGGF